jgi:Small nuclear ribonucleoprotein (snRNP) homolog
MESCVTFGILLQLVELKNGETYNGHLVSCDNWMNINLREVICTSRVSISLTHVNSFVSKIALSKM